MLLHSFNDDSQFFPQTTEEQEIAGNLIPKGYVNLTLMCKSQGREVKTFLKTNTAKEYLKALQTKIQDHGADIPRDKNGEEQLENGEEQLENGGNSNNILISISDKQGVEGKLRGTWAHPEFAIRVAIWISPHFGVWATDVLLKILNNEFTPNSPEVLKSQEIFKKAWRAQLALSRRQRRRFTDCLKEAIIRTYGEDYYHSPASAALFAKYTAIAQKQLTGFPDFNGNRENCTEEELEILEKFESKFATLFEFHYPEDMRFDEIFHLVLKKMN